MKSLFRAGLTALFGIYFALLAQPLWAAQVYDFTDGDADFFVFEGGLNVGQFLALTRPNVLPGAFWAISLQNQLDHDEVVKSDFIVDTMGDSQFSVALWDTVDWHFPDSEAPVGVLDDAAILHWDFDHGVDQHRSIKMVAVDVSAVPVPGAVWLFGSGLLGLVGVGRGAFFS
jgi:hypothetical protein